ncbi:MAG: DUF3592 domain-containing protein [Clostridia bacterium]|nr:DUF3592 domain-containing protein [Clostridia bacterium]
MLLSYNPTVEFDVGNADAPNLMKKKYKPVNSLYEYRAGQKVKVFYNPKNHEEFYLDCDDKKKTKMVDYKAGALFILIGLVIVAVPLAVLYR